MLLTAFGTNVDVSRLCKAFQIELDSGSLDKVLFIRRIMNNQESDRDIELLFNKQFIAMTTDRDY